MRPEEEEQPVPLEHEPVDAGGAFLGARDVLLDVALDHLDVRLVLVADHVRLEDPEQPPHGRGDGVCLRVPAPDPFPAKGGDPFAELRRRDVQCGGPVQQDILRHAPHALLEEPRIFLEGGLAESPYADHGPGVHRAHLVVDPAQQPHIGLVLGLHGLCRGSSPALAAPGTGAEPEPLLALLENEAVETKRRDGAHAREDVADVLFVAQADRVEVVQERGARRRDHPFFRVLDAVRAVVRVQAHIGEDLHLE